MGMITPERMEDELPSPILLRICCLPEDCEYIIRERLDRILDLHNENYETKIEYITSFCINEQEGVLSWNEFEVYVGKTLVHKGKGPEWSIESVLKLEAFYKLVLDVVEGVLETWHDKIIEVQMKNYEKLEDCIKNGYDELVYAYYYYHDDDRAFGYLKRLAMRYPNGSYMRRLRRIYRMGTSRQAILASKLHNRWEGRNF